MNNLVMIDSSCWIKFFRNTDKNIADLVQNLIQTDRACLCGIIELEILQGIKSSNQSILVRDLFTFMPYFDFQRNDFINAGNKIRELRLSGITVAISDTLIAELCIRNKIPIYTTDTDFNYFQNIQKYIL